MVSIPHFSAQRQDAVGTPATNSAGGCRRPRRQRVATALLSYLLLAVSVAKPGFAAEGAFDDDPRPMSADAAAVVAAGKDRAELIKLRDQFLAVFGRPDASAADMQEAAQNLGFVLVFNPALKESAVRDRLGQMLVLEERVDFARLALDRVPGKDVDKLYLQALKTATGRTRVALIQSVGTREIASAVPLLKPLLGDADAGTRSAATHALGAIGGKAALATLESVKNPLAPEILNARLAAAAKAEAAVAARTAEAIYRDAAAPLPQRAAALRLLIAKRPPAAVTLIAEALRGTERLFQQAALESVATLSARGAAAALAKELPTFAPDLQIALIAALGNLGDAGAHAGLLAILESKDADVRLAAIDALGRLPGTVDVAQRLAALAAGTGADARAAATSLARLAGPGIDAAVRAGATTGDVKLRAVFIGQIAARGLTEDVPFLLGLRGAAESDVRLAALDALRDLAPPAQQQAVIDWALGAANRGEQARAVRALITIILRDDATATRAATVLTALERGDAAARVALLPVLSRVAGAPAVAAAGQYALDADATVAQAAVGELARWPDDSAWPVLVEVALKTKVESVRAAAVRGAADFLGRSGAVPADERSAHARSLLALPVGAAEKNALLFVLSLCGDAAALETAQRHASDPATADAARDAVDALTSTLAGPPGFKASNDAEDLKNLVDGDMTTAWTVPNTPGEWLFVDLHNSRPVRKLTLNQGGRRSWGFPAKVEVCVSDDPDQPGDKRTEAEGERGKTIVTLPAGVRGRYVWIRQTGHRDPDWSIAELLVE